MEQQATNQLINIVLSGFGGAIIGAILGGFAASIGQYYYTKKHIAELEKKTILNLARALSIELSSFWDTYMPTINEAFEDSEADESKFVPITSGLTGGIFEIPPQNIFIVFNNSANLLGLLDLKTAEQVIKTYINVKAFLDELIYYKKLSDQYQELQCKRAFENMDKVEKFLADHFNILFPFARLKHRFGEVKELVASTTETLKKISCS